MEHLEHKQKVTIMIAIIAAMLFAALNQTIVGTALPRIIAELGGMEYYSWIFTIYMLASSVTAILAGKLSDIYGRKPFILLGLGVFIIASLLCGLAETIIQLILYRALQGLGGGLIMSTAFTAIGDLFAPRERGRWQGVMSGVFGLASVFGPTLGGYIVDNADWHWIFWIFLPFGIVAFALIFYMFPSVPRKEGEAVDYFGSVFLTATLIPMLLAFSWAGSKFAWGSSEILSLFAISLAALTIFLLIERKVKSPVLPLFLFKNSIFTLSNMIGFMIGVGMFGAIMYMPIFVQGVIGTSATASGFVMMPMSLSMVLASSVCGQLITKTGKYKTMALFGLFIMIAGLFLMSRMDSHTTNTIAVLYMIVVGLGLGTAFPIFTLTVQNAVEQRLLGVATASTQLFRQLGGTVGVSVMGTVMSQRMMDGMQRTAAEGSMGQIADNPALASKLAALQNPQVLMDPAKLEAIQSNIPASIQPLFDQLVQVLREALSYSLIGVFLSAAIAVGIGFLLTFFLEEIPLRSAAPKTETATSLTAEKMIDEQQREMDDAHNHNVLK
ncbi:MDR family MFS transporter [Aneurinibacillus sp. REN35]|uniref:MDR family MFS transporter n=1 Tax=Aneurinibacillus sp. REN35 TaxID=3237286 RepID=UPI003527E6E7